MEQNDKGRADIAIEWLRARPFPAEGIDIRLTGAPIPVANYERLLQLLLSEEGEEGKV